MSGWVGRLPSRGHRRPIPERAMRAVVVPMMRGATISVETSFPDADEVIIRMLLFLRSAGEL